MKNFFDSIGVIMKSLLYSVALFLTIIWVVGFFGYHLGGVTHLLLVIALILVVLKMTERKKSIIYDDEYEL